MPDWSPLARLPRSMQWFVALLGAIVFFAAAIALVRLAVHDLRFFLVTLLVAPVLPAGESLFVTPFYSLVGRFQYLSPMLLATRRRDGGLDLHVGTIFDYVMLLRWRDRGPRAARIVSTEILRGLLALCADVRRGAVASDAPIVATSYFFSDRSLARLGFTTATPSSAALLNLYLSAISIGIRLSFTRGRLAMPDLRRIREARTTAGALAERDGEIRRLLAKVDEPPGANKGCARNSSAPRHRRRDPRA